MGLIEKLLEIKDNELQDMLTETGLWNSLDVNYHPPRVERLWRQYDEHHRLFIHIIHKTTAACLFHKHKWEAAFHMIFGSYEMALTSSETEFGSEEAYKLPEIARHIIAAGSSYEMRYTHTAHYVKPLGDYSISLMLTKNIYPEERKEVEHGKLPELPNERIIEILDEVYNKLYDKN